MTNSMILSGIDRQPLLETFDEEVRDNTSGLENGTSATENGEARTTVADADGSPRRVNGARLRTPRSRLSRAQTTPSQSTLDGLDEDEELDGPEYNDQRAHEVTHGRLVQGHIVPDDFPSPSMSAADASVTEEDPMTMSHASSFFAPQPHALGGSGDAAASSDEEDEILKDPKVEHMITLVGDVKNRTVLIVDDMIDKPGSWIAAAETVVKRGHAKKVYCIATHAVFGGDCLQQMQDCDCIDAIVVTNSYPIPEDKARDASKLVVLDLSFLLAEAIRRNHYGESMSPLFQHIVD